MNLHAPAITDLRAALLIDSQCTLGEGPMWCDHTRRLYWVDITARKLWQWQSENAAIVTRELECMPSACLLSQDNHLAFTSDEGLHVAACASSGVRGSFSARVYVEAEKTQTRSNEAQSDPYGRLLISTMDRNCQARIGRLYQVDADGCIRMLLQGLGIPNTLVWSRCGQTLYAGDSMDATIYAWDYDPHSGDLRNRRRFFSTTDHHFPEGAVPDGSTRDQDGCLWTAIWDGSCVVRISPDGELLTRIPLPVSRPTSCIFGGEKLDTLYITSARKGLSSTQLLREPLAGGVFTCTPGVRGDPAYRLRI